MKLNTTATQRRADTVHNPGGQTVTPEDKPPSVQLEGERKWVTSLNVEANDIRTVDHDHNTQQLPRRPMDTPDSDKHHPNGPTEPPDEKDGEQGVDEPRGRGGNEDESRELKGEPRDEVEDDNSQRDGPTSDMGSPMSSTSPK
ncbi:hypothetical protein BDN67DRAFT_1014125 [Paxillus ammoniavirescens]|nr:hypothetical protein BDN67DRAFT_1014125 [Paxillus ammoniavirescens]